VTEVSSVGFRGPGGWAADRPAVGAAVLAGVGARHGRRAV